MVLLAASVRCCCPVGVRSSERRAAGCAVRAAARCRWLRRCGAAGPSVCGRPSDVLRAASVRVAVPSVRSRPSEVLLAARCVLPRGAAGCLGAVLLSLRCAVVRATCCCCAVRAAAWCCGRPRCGAAVPSVCIRPSDVPLDARGLLQRGAAAKHVGARRGPRRAGGGFSTPDRPRHFLRQMPHQCVGNVGNMLENHRAKGFRNSGSGRGAKARFLDLGRLYPGGGKQWFAPVPTLLWRCWFGPVGNLGAQPVRAVGRCRTVACRWLRRCGQRIFTPRPTPSFFETNAAPMRWKRGKHVGEPPCERILEFGFGKGSEGPFPRSRTFIPRRWETMVGTCPCIIVALLRRSGRLPRCAGGACGALRRPRAVGRCVLAGASVRSLCRRLRRVRSGGACVVLRRPRSVPRSLSLSLRCLVVRAACGYLYETLYQDARDRPTAPHLALGTWHGARARSAGGAWSMLLALRACCCCGLVLSHRPCRCPFGAQSSQRRAAGCAVRAAPWCCWLPRCVVLSLRCAVVPVACCLLRGACCSVVPPAAVKPVGARCGPGRAGGACGRFSTPDRPPDFSRQMQHQRNGNVGNMSENHRAKGFLNSGSGRPPKARFLDLGRLYPGGGKQWLAPVPAL